MNENYRQDYKEHLDFRPIHKKSNFSINQNNKQKGNLG